MATEAFSQVISRLTDLLNELATKTKPADLQNVTGTVTANQGGTWTVQPGNTTNTTAWLVTGTGGTFPVTGTVTSNQGGAPWTSRVQDGVGATLATVTAGNALKTDSSATTQPISAATLPLPSGAATAANQLPAGHTVKVLDTAGVNQLSVTAANAAKVDGSAVTQPISAATLPLPSGAATEATLVNKANEGASITGQTLEAGGSSVLGWLSSLRKAITDRLPAALVGGRLDVNIGAAPATVTVQGNQPARTTGTIISATSTVTVTAADKLNVATVTVNGTYAGVSFVVEGSDDGGTTWYGLQAIDNALGQILQTITPGTNATKSYDVTLGGYNQFRVRATAWTSGTANIGISLQAMPYEGTPGALIGDGTNGPATVKPGSTAAVAADKPLVVALHPTTPLPAGTAIIGALTANQAVNVAQVAGSATPTGEGTAATAGTQRHVLGTLGGTSSAPHANVSLGQSTGKTNQLKTGTLATVATTADQVILTFTVTAGKTFYLEYLTVEVYFTAISATATLLGNWSLETPSGTKVITEQAVNPTTSQPYQFQITFPEPIPVAAAVVVRVVCTPATVTSITWRANFGGYEK